MYESSFFACFSRGTAAFYIFARLVRMIIVRKWCSWSHFRLECCVLALSQSSVLWQLLASICKRGPVYVECESPRYPGGLFPVEYA